MTNNLYLRFQANDFHCNVDGMFVVHIRVLLVQVRWCIKAELWLVNRLRGMMPLDTNATNQLLKHSSMKLSCFCITQHVVVNKQWITNIYIYFISKNTA